MKQLKPVKWSFIAITMMLLFACEEEKDVVFTEEWLISLDVIGIDHYENKELLEITNTGTAKLSFQIQDDKDIFSFLPSSGDIDLNEKVVIEISARDQHDIGTFETNIKLKLNDSTQLLPAYLARANESSVVALEGSVVDVVHNKITNNIYIALTDQVLVYNDGKLLNTFRSDKPINCIAIDEHSNILAIAHQSSVYVFDLNIDELTESYSLNWGNLGVFDIEIYNEFIILVSDNWSSERFRQINRKLNIVEEVRGYNAGKEKIKKHPFNYIMYSEHYLVYLYPDEGAHVGNISNESLGDNFWIANDGKVFTKYGRVYDTYLNDRYLRNERRLDYNPNIVGYKSGIHSIDFNLQIDNLVIFSTDPYKDYTLQVDRLSYKNQELINTIGINGLTQDESDTKDFNRYILHDTEKNRVHLILQDKNEQWKLESFTLE